MSSTDTTPDIPEKSWSNPFSEGTFMYDIYGDVVSEHRDIIIILDDKWGRRGTGKTVKSLKLAAAMDQTEVGITKTKTSLQPEEIRNAYASQPKRSGIVLDEAEFGASNRQAMSKTNQALREIMSMGRVEEKYVVINTPIRGFIDTDLQKLADVWMTVARKGLVLVHHLEWEPYSENLLTKKKQWLYFDDIEKGTDLRDVYNYLTKEKRKHIAGEDGEKFVPQEKHQKVVEKVKEKAQRTTRDELLQNLYKHPAKPDGLTQQYLADCVGLTQAGVSSIMQRDTEEQEVDAL